MQSTPSSKTTITEVSTAKPLKGFHWLFEGRYDQHWLTRTVDGVQVASLTKRVNGEWMVTVDRHLWNLKSAKVPSLSRGKAWAEAWAYVHRERLLVEPREPMGGWRAESHGDD